MKIRSKSRVEIYWYTIVIIILMGTSIPGYTSDYPQWLKEYHGDGLKSDKIYFGVGSSDFSGERPDDDCRKESKDRALNELCYQLSVSVKSEFKEKLCQKGEYSDQAVESSLLVSAQNVISGIEVKEQWTDSRNNVYWVMVIIDKANADAQVRQQNFVEKVVDQLESNQEEMLAGIKKIHTDLDQQMQFFKDQYNNRLSKLLQTAEHKSLAASDQNKTEITNLENKVEKLGNMIEILLRENKSMQSFLKKSIGNTSIKTLMGQKKAIENSYADISDTIQNDYFLALAEDDVKNQRINSKFKVSITPSKGQGAEYFEGERIKFRVEASKNCYIKVIHLSTIGESVSGEIRREMMLFPNVHDQNNFVRAGQVAIIGKKGELFAQKPFGKDIVTVVASEHPFTDIEEKLRQAAASGKAYHEDTMNNSSEAVHSRSIGIEPVSTFSTSAADTTFVSDTCFITTNK